MRPYKGFLMSLRRDAKWPETQVSCDLRDDFSARYVAANQGVRFALFSYPIMNCTRTPPQAVSSAVKRCELQRGDPKNLLLSQPCDEARVQELKGGGLPNARDSGHSTCLNGKRLVCLSCMSAAEQNVCKSFPSIIPTACQRK